MSEIYLQAEPYPWPYDGNLTPQNTALIGVFGAVSDAAALLAVLGRA